VSVIASCMAISATANVGGAPTVQYADRLDTSHHEQLAGLYVTQLEGYAFEFAWVVARLPCPAGVYRFFATEASIGNSQDSSAESRVRLLWARLPQGIHCGSPLPSGSGQGLITITIMSQSPTTETGTPAIVYEGNSVKIDSSSPCIRLSGVCEGRYLLIATLETPHRRLKFVYAFSVANTESSGRARGLMSGMRQCPIR
jgi:hypothetical protein